MIKTILIPFLLLIIIWFYREKKEAQKEYDPFSDNEKWTDQERKIYTNYMKKNKKRILW